MLEEHWSLVMVLAPYFDMSFGVTNGNGIGSDRELGCLGKQLSYSDPPVSSFPLFPFSMSSSSSVASPKLQR